jgi:F-type H+-transporting ATPase subunit b
MITLNALLKPDVGLMFWTLLIFLLLLIILRKFAWNPIIKALKDREEGIESALEEARIARKEVEEVRQNSEAIVNQAQMERDRILREVQQKRDELIGKSKEDALHEKNRIIMEAKEAAAREIEIAIKSAKAELAGMVMDIAVKIIRQELKDPDTQKKLIEEELRQRN